MRIKSDQALLIASTLGFSWLAMQLIHEAGHVFGAWFSGGSVDSVLFAPWDFSRTVLSGNPHPLFVAWAGPIGGALLPLLLWVAARMAQMPRFFLLRFFSAFCLAANGAYIGLGSFSGIADAGDLLRFGAPAWSLWIFGSISCSLGIGLWHGQGSHFGFGTTHGKVERPAVLTAFLLFLSMFAISTVWGVLFVSRLA